MRPSGTSTRCAAERKSARVLKLPFRDARSGQRGLSIRRTTLLLEEEDLLICAVDCKYHILRFGSHRAELTRGVAASEDDIIGRQVRFERAPSCTEGVEVQLGVLRVWESYAAGRGFQSAPAMFCCATSEV